MSESKSTYRGRFAPSPTGDLHMGSLLAALISYLEARRNGGVWLVRIEDIDTPRVVPGSADRILATLEQLGFEWDEQVLYQSTRTEAYAAALTRLQAADAVYPCGCTRAEITDSALARGPEGPIYPGTCRDGLPPGKQARAWRVRTKPEPVCFDDIWQARICQNLAKETGDFVVRRADGLYAYQLAVVIDDAEQGITQVVRGADLLASTPRQIFLQGLLDLPMPEYAHFPVLLGADGHKLSKQSNSLPVLPAKPVQTLLEALAVLNLHPPAGIAAAPKTTLWQWLFENWEPSFLMGRGQTFGVDANVAVPGT